MDGRTRPPDENATFSSPGALRESARKQLRETPQNSRAPQTSVSRLVLKDKPQTVFWRANKKSTCTLHSADTLVKATTTCRISNNINLLQRSFQLLQILAKSVSEFLSHSQTCASAYGKIPVWKANCNSGKGDK